MTKYKRYTSKDGATLTMSQWGGSPAELELYRKLAELEDKIENGTLIELPCKKGDNVFAIVNTTAYDNSIITGTIEGLAYIILDEYGDITFQHISRVSLIKPKQS